MIRLKHILYETIQLADKIYFKTGKLSAEDRDLILDITGGNNYTKIMSDILFHLKNHDRQSDYKTALTTYYNMLINYDKNIFPMLGLNDINRVDNIGSLLYFLENRENIITMMKKLPSIAVRNLKSEIRQQRNIKEIVRYNNDMDYFVTHLSYLSNKSEETKNKIYQKMFKSNTTLDDLLNFVEEKKNLIGSVDVTKEEIIKLVHDENDMTLVYNEKSILVVKIESPEAIRSIGCNSLWCFTYGAGLQKAYKQWNDYSTNGIVYVIFDFREKAESPDFMNVVIKPIDFSDTNDKHDENFDAIYDLTNVPQYYPLAYLKRTMSLSGARKILTFK